MKAVFIAALIMIALLINAAHNDKILNSLCSDTENKVMVDCK